YVTYFFLILDEKNQLYLQSIFSAYEDHSQKCVDRLRELQCCFVWTANANNVALANPIYRFGETLLEFWEELGDKPIKFCQQTLTTRLLTERQRAADLVEQKEVALNCAIDSLRQSATDDQVTDRLNEVLRLLDMIKTM
ncbi:hypothetical protein P879_10941, partial [Paragonimus westermani]